MSTSQDHLSVELRAGKIPWISLIAVHYWFVIKQGETTERWEVWQKRDVKSPSWGNLHLNLLPPEQGVGCGESWVEAVFIGEQANALIEILRSSPDNYPNKYNYRYWPGPNSNSYVQWILDQAMINHQLHPVGIGKNHLGLAGFQQIAGVTTLSTPLLGIKYSSGKYFEIHFCHLAMAVTFKPFKLKSFIRF